MNGNNDIVTTSISISKSLFKAAKSKAALEYRSFSQHVSFLLDMDLKRDKKKYHYHVADDTSVLPPTPNGPEFHENDSARPQF